MTPTTERLQVSLQLQAPARQFGQHANITPTANGYQIHLQQGDETRAVQKAARQLDTLGVTDVTLTGDWPLELQWAFYQGFVTAKRQQGVQFTGDPAIVAQLEQLVTCYRFAKNLTNQTPEQLSPEKLAEQAADFIQDLAGKKHISYRIVRGEQLAAEGWHGIYQVGRGSERAPAMLELDFNPTGKADSPVVAALVGKGITFDSGGYSIKPTEGMLHMKCDMGGAATVTAALGLAILKGLNQRVKLILCCAENLISGHAYKLGDIITYKNGTTVEIVNTDAEGRLVLADGLQLASDSGASLIIDAATLTGAAVTAVGTEYNALFALDHALAQRALTYAAQQQERLWQLPLEKWHQQQCPSAFADTANSRPVKGGGDGGASNAAGFLSRFVANNGQGWLHFDLAAAYRDSGNALWAPGATGQGIRTIAATLLHEVQP